MRIAGLLLALGLSGGCVSDGSFADGGPGSSGIRWSRPYGSDPFSRGSSVFGGYPYGSDRYSRSDYGGRTFNPSRGVVCDRATETCYRGREIDASETRDYFGRGAAREVDRIRDGQGTNRIYRASDRVVCNRKDQVCYKNGHPDVSETRDYFGKKASRRID